MTGKNAREQPLEELAEMFKVLQDKAKTQAHAIKKFQKFIKSEGLFSHAVNCFPYPMAAFKYDGDLVYINNALSDKTGLSIADLSKAKHSILNRITDQNFQILDAVENVFLGETAFLSNLSDPLAMFISDRSDKKISFPSYRNAVFFPILEDGNQITLGAALFMK
ncbi:hypothetical protein [Desulfitobacterium sp. PCE1]|uniref:hypothetical protein n=1 Tax=Desulfitobacterium sp. PCE1 TaxID=146907 RepID=UPI0003715D15|nr:hypothetical protein [Desulfitobacterium sp. PCE1]